MKRLVSYDVPRINLEAGAAPHHEQQLASFPGAAVKQSKMSVHMKECSRRRHSICIATVEVRFYGTGSYSFSQNGILHVLVLLISELIGIPLAG